LSVIKFSTSIVCNELIEAWTWRLAGVSDVRLLLNALVDPVSWTTLWCDNYLHFSSFSSSVNVFRKHFVSGLGFALVCLTWFIRVGLYLLSNRLCMRTIFDYLTSNQVGLPAELKHINKRRKRN
jgi:hypothetical protein